ncbi:MAG: hypothetical protein J6J62_04630 [Oscillospiraceae bacterium]|nr:hypothetical protein [Oscillospiraceae bacterium]
MTARERVLTSQLIQKLDNNESYARKLGLSCAMLSAGSCKTKEKIFREEERRN